MTPDHDRARVDLDNGLNRMRYHLNKLQVSEDKPKAAETVKQFHRRLNLVTKDAERIMKELR
jgi:hypothetical protein